MIRLPSSVVVPAVMGCLLRLYELVFLERVASLGAALIQLSWSCLPFLLALAISAIPRLQTAAIGFTSACLLGSFYAHYVLFLAPSPEANTALILLLPLWSLFVLGPAGAVAGWLLIRKSVK
jgi:hypothetical protein